MRYRVATGRTFYWTPSKPILLLNVPLLFYNKQTQIEGAGYCVLCVAQRAQYKKEAYYFMSGTTIIVRLYRYKEVTVIC